MPASSSPPRRPSAFPIRPARPLFVLIAHVWALLVPLGEYAVRTNLLSAIFSAAGAGLLLSRGPRVARPAPSLRRRATPRVGSRRRPLAALFGAFTFTNWQNSNETEVYAVATFTIAAMSWLVLSGAAAGPRSGPGACCSWSSTWPASRIGNHLLALLAGPGVVAFLVVTLLRDPAPRPGGAAAEWGQVAVVAGVWALLIGTGLGSTELIALGGACFVAAAVYAAMGGAGGFALAALLIAAVGVTPYLYIYIGRPSTRSINEAAPGHLRRAARRDPPGAVPAAHAARRSRRCRTAPTIPAARSACSGPARSTTSSTSTGSGPRRSRTGSGRW